MDKRNEEVSPENLAWLHAMGLPQNHTIKPGELLYINECIRLGHGWQRYALSVMRQGWCSTKQKETLRDMVERGNYVADRVKRGPRNNYSSDSGGCGIGEVVEAGGYGFGYGLAE